jgi:hypothetical protein
VEGSIDYAMRVPKRGLAKGGVLQGVEEARSSSLGEPRMRLWLIIGGRSGREGTDQHLGVTRPRPPLVRG